MTDEPLAPVPRGAGARGLLSAGFLAALLAGVANAASAATAAAPLGLPEETLAALQHVGVPADAVSAVVFEVGSGRSVLQWNAARPVNPASLMKLVTTAAALDRLGPAYSWTTPVWLNGAINNGVLEGNLVIKGSGDPKLVVERVWLLLRRVQQLGVREIRGDIVLDNTAFVVPEVAPGDFDGEPLRPYNVRASALLFNFRSSLYSFVPDPAAGVARIGVEPPLAGTVVDRSVPLVAGPCDDWRTALKASFEPGRARFTGNYAAACGESTWPVADPQPNTFELRLIDALWREMGGQLRGSAREGQAPVDAKPSFELHSPPLAELVRDINKYSNNLMAQQLFMSIALQAAPRVPATPEAARAALLSWLAERTGPLADEVVVDNGSGLSRLTRISAARLGKVLLQAWDGPVMSELMSSLPITGLDGTMKRSRASAGRGHLKTGTLRDVTGVAGYVLANGGRRYVLVAIVNHPQAPAARPALDALVQWALRKN